MWNIIVYIYIFYEYICPHRGVERMNFRATPWKLSKKRGHLLEFMKDHEFYKRGASKLVIPGREFVILLVLFFWTGGGGGSRGVGRQKLAGESAVSTTYISTPLLFLLNTSV